MAAAAALGLHVGDECRRRMSRHTQDHRAAPSLGRLHKRRGRTSTAFPRLNLDTNPFEHPPLSISKQGPGAIARYFADHAHLEFDIVNIEVWDNAVDVSCRRLTVLCPWLGGLGV